MHGSTKNMDGNIVLRLKEGEEKALTELYDKYWKALYVSSYNILRDKSLCEDIVQEVFMDLWKKRNTLNINVSLKSYLYACVRYQVFAQIRKDKNKIRLEVYEDLDKRLHYGNPEVKLIHKEFVEQIETIIESLPEKCRKVYKLSRIEELSHKEISDRLNISTKTVENHITKALRVLKLQMGGFLTFLLSLWSNLWG